MWVVTVTVPSGSSSTFQSCLWMSVWVSSASEHEAGEGGGAAAGEPDDVVGFAVFRPDGAGADAAVLVADGDELPQVGGHGVDGAAVVDDLAVGLHDEPAQGAVAQHG